MSVDALREHQNSLARNVSAIMLPTEEGFAYISDGTIAATVSLDGLAQKGSATEASLTIGNLTSGLLQKCSMVVQVRPSKDAYFEAGSAQQISGGLFPGKFNKRTLLIPDTKVESISALQVSSLLCERVLMTT